jgi:TPR repeat protein/formylglycine-generating enzyme required for sulfatase activity
MTSQNMSLHTVNTPFRILIAFVVQILIVTAAPVGICLHAYSPEAPAEKIECFEFEKVERAGPDYRFFPSGGRSVVVTAYRFRGTIPYRPALAPTHPEFEKLLKLYEETARATPSTRPYLNPKILAMRGQAAGVAKQAESVAALPSITVADGSKLVGCTMSKIEDGFVSIRHQDGISKVSLKELDAAEKKGLNSTTDEWSLDDPSVTPKDSTGKFAKIVFKNGRLLKKAKFKEVADGNLVFMADGKSVSVPVDQFPGELSVLGDEVVELLAPVKKNSNPEPSVASSGGAVFQNSLGMKFAPVPIKGGATDGQNVLFSIWETRQKDFKAFVDATGYDATKSIDPPLLARMRGLRSDGITMKNHWADCGFEITPDHPVNWMSWQDGRAFCKWLTEKERADGIISKNQKYRLPSDHEWSCAVGIGTKENALASPEEKNGEITLFPWGPSWPPPENFGNYQDGLNQDGLKVDRFEYTSSVGSFRPNEFGIYDMSGNVLEYCEFVGKHRNLHHLWRGGSFCQGFINNGESLQLSYRSLLDHWLDESRSIDTGFRCVLVTEVDDVGKSKQAATDESEALMKMGDEASKEGWASKELLQALKHYDKAEELGHPEAAKKIRKVMFWLAENNLEKEDEDKSETARWYREAAERGSARAQWGLAKCLYSGHGVDADTVESVKWAQQAAKNGLLDAQMGVAGSYRRGVGVLKHLKTAAEWYRKAAERGLPEAQYELGFFIGLGDAPPERGKSARESELEWYEKAAYQQVVEAQFSMGLAYESGNGLAKDLVKAYMWLSLASARQKNTPLDAIAYNPKNVLKSISKEMSDQQIQEGERMLADWKPKHPIAWRSREIEELSRNDAD